MENSQDFNSWANSLLTSANTQQTPSSNATSNANTTTPSAPAETKGIDLNVQKGDFFALLGANGAGKSTIISLISTLVPKSSGQIVINGYSIEKI